MAITCITGIPRSGKSYYSVYLLYMSFVYEQKETKLSKILDKYVGKFSSKKLKKNYDVAYTNINQFNFSKSSKIKPFDYAMNYTHLVNLHTMYTQKKTDDELIIYAKANNLYNALFVIDECQNYFDKDDLILTWWFTYHGHLHQDIMLITQNFDLIFTGYTKLGEFFYKAVPPSSRFFSNKFRYVQYNSYKCYAKEKIGDFHVPMIPAVFDMYVSGASNSAPSQVKKYLSVFVILLIILIIMFQFFISQFETEKETQIIEENSTLSSSSQMSQTVKKETKQKQSEENEEEEKEIKNMLFEIRCINMQCSYNGVEFPKPILNILARDYDPPFLWSVADGSYVQFFMILPSNALDFLPKKETKTKKGTENANGAKTTDKNNPLINLPTSK